MSDPPGKPDPSQSPPGWSASGRPEVVAATLTEVYGESALQVVLHQLCHGIIAGDAEGERAWIAVADIIERQVKAAEREQAGVLPLRAKRPAAHD